jgi:serine/threonine protein phosphatase 1
MNGRIIAIGDVHGCFQELDELLQRLAPRKDDRLIFLGDLVNRGPDSNKVIDLVRQYNGFSLLGNHELRLLQYKKSGSKDLLKEGDIETVERLRPEDWAMMENMPLTHYIEDLNTVFVHGGFLPNEPWQKQPAQVVTRIQVIDEQGKPRKRADCPTCPAWADLWSGPPFVVYGHTPRAEIYKLKWSVGIDTACVQGGHLTAYVLPEKRFVQVKAKKRYYS